MDVGGDDCFLANSSSRLSFRVVDVFRESVEITIFNVLKCLIKISCQLANLSRNNY